MDISCYRGTPKIIGALIDALYQNPALLFAAVAGAAALAGLWWYKTANKTE